MRKDDETGEKENEEKTAPDKYAHAQIEKKKIE